MKVNKKSQNDEIELIPPDDLGLPPRKHPQDEDVITVEDVPYLAMTGEPPVPDEELIPVEEVHAPSDETAGQESSITVDEDSIPTSFPEVDDEELLKQWRRIRRKRILRSTLRFYSILFGGILGVLILLICLMKPLQTLLEQYETSRPAHTADAIYELLFADPDWALLYDMAEVEGTQFEGRSAYVTYMQAKVGQQELRCTEVPTGLSGQKRYSIRLGSEEVAAFTMYSYDDGVSTFPLWTLDQVEVFFTRTESLSVIKMPEYTVYINGVPLDSNYTVLTVETAAENYLPDDLDGYHYELQQITGLLIQPELVVMDEFNNILPLTQDPVTGVYSTPIPESEQITDEEYATVLAAAQAEALFAIRNISASQLRQYFDPNSGAYEELGSTDAVLKKYESFAFDDEATVIKDFYRYSDTLFSVHVTVKLDVTVSSKKTETITVSTTYLFSENSAGAYMVTERFDEDLQERFTIVRLCFEQDGELIGEILADPAEEIFTLPVAESEDGIFIGWGKPDASGDLTLVFELHENGYFALAAGQSLPYGTLYPVFE